MTPFLLMQPGRRGGGDRPRRRFAQSEIAGLFGEGDAPPRGRRRPRLVVLLLLLLVITGDALMIRRPELLASGRPGASPAGRPVTTS